ncbi:MAG: pyridoxal-5'-phosphate-dependent protein subunit beta [Anaerolineales bacterium]|nr:pyridoxal-phosphate dependent enzyme [Anaerolineae bacterium]PWB74643.1 MAG: pyridoxal-5'-phosphate-dependent protein subunit beta [Anaerolineales bacterium]
MGLPVSSEKRVYDNVLGAMGNTPLVRLKRIGRDLPCPLYAKLELMNPGGSVKDRVGAFIIEQAEKRGELKPGGTIVEATSGNTGVGLAIAAALKGYKTIFVMPDKMSNEKILLLRAYGAKVVITPTAVEPDDPRSYYEVAKKFARETPNAILANQYHNPDNPKTHELSTGPEIWEQTEGRVTDVIIGMGTGGTISGIGRYLKSKNPNIKIVGVDIEGSILTEIWQNKGKIPEGAYPKTYKVEGIGEDFLPSATDLSVIDAIERAGDRESFLWARQLVRQEGIFAGGSSGSAIAGALKYCRRLTPERLAVVILPDSGSRYLSKFYDDKWMREFGFLSMEFGETALGDLLIAKPDKTLYMAKLGDSMRKVVSVMHEHAISQMPVVGEDGALVGLIEEVDLLNHMLEEHAHTQEEPIDPLVQNASAVFPSDTSLEEAMDALKSGLALLVVEDSRPIGILTKIDVLDYVAGKI